MKVFHRPGPVSSLATLLFFLLIASLIAIKVNYFTDPKYKTSSRVELNGTSYESHPASFPFSMRGANAVSNPELLSLLTETVRENGWNIEFYTPHPAGNKMITSEIPFLANYFLKSTRFVKQDFEIEMKDRNNFVVAYEYGGIKRIRSVKAGQTLNEIELTLSITCHERINPVIQNDYINKLVIAVIYSPQAFAEKLIKHHLTVTCKKDASTIITINYPDQNKAKLMADAIAYQLAQHEHMLKNKQIDEALSKVMNAEMQPSGKSTTPDDAFPAKAQETIMASLINKRNELSLQLKALDNLHDYLRQNRIDGNAVPAFGTVNDPVFAEYITSLNTKIHQLKNTTVAEEQLKLNHEIEFLKNTLAEGMRNTRKTVALQMEETSRQLALLHKQLVNNSAPDVSETPLLEQQLAQKKLNVLLDKKANASEVASVSPAPVPLTPENPDHATVWMICLVSGLLCALAFGKIFRKKKPVIVQVQQEERPEELFTTLSDAKGNSAQQIKKWAEEILALRKQENQPCLVTITHAVNNSSSITALELASAATASGNKVLVMDANLDKAQMETLAGIEIPETFSDMLVYGKPFHECIAELPTGLKLVCIDMKSHDFHPLFLINKMQEMLSDLPAFDMVLIAAPSSQESLTLSLIRMSTSAFVIHSKGRYNKSITQRWKNFFRIEHVYDVVSDNTLPVPQQLKSKQKIRSIRNRINNEPEKMNWLRRAALWFY